MSENNNIDFSQYFHKYEIPARLGVIKPLEVYGEGFSKKIADICGDIHEIEFFRPPKVGDEFIQAMYGVFDPPQIATMNFATEYPRFILKRTFKLPASKYTFQARDIYKNVNLEKFKKTWESGKFKFKIVQAGDKCIGTYSGVLFTAFGTKSIDHPVWVLID